MTPTEQMQDFARRLQSAADEKARAREEKSRNAVFQQIGQYLSAALSPLREAVKQMVGAANEMKRVAASVDRISDITIPTPQINVDLSSFPTPNVTVKPVIDIPDMKFPKDIEMRGFVTLMGYDRGLLENPLPVQLRDAKGNPIKLFENLTTLVQGGGGGGFQTVRVSNLNEISLSATVSTSVTLVNADGTKYDSANPLPVTFSAAGSQLVQQVSGAMDSVNIMQIGGNPVTQGPGEGAAALRVVHASDAIASVNVVGNIAALDVKQVSGSTDSVSIVSNIAALDVKQVSGSADSVSIVSNIASLDVIQVSGSNWSVFVTGSSGTTSIVGDVAPGSANVNSPPVRVGGVSTQTNPTAIADGNVINFRADDLGRQLTRPLQVRDLIATAYASVTNGTETTLLAGVASTYLDCIMMVGSNNSDAAVSVDIRPSTGGNIVHTLRIPANGTAGWAPSVPWPADELATAWTVDGPDETGRTLTFSALFSKEV